jgi:hypothetical protein
MAVMKVAGIGAVGGALAALTLILAPAIAAPAPSPAKKRAAPSLRGVGGSFTPAVADPGLARELARRGFNGTSFRFTPTATSATKNGGAVRVAVRARAATPAQAMRSVAEGSASQVTAITPTAYNIGVSVGWRGLALSGDVAEVKGGVVPGGRRNAEVSVGYSAKRFTGRVEAGVDKVDVVEERITPLDSSYSVGAAASYQIARNLDVTGGVRYKIQRDRLEPLADQRRDSQAVYVGTAFRF